MKNILTLLLAGATVLAFCSCTTVVHPTKTRTIYKKSYSKPRSSSSAYVAPARSYDTPEGTTVIRPAE